MKNLKNFSRLTLGLVLLLSVGPLYADLSPAVAQVQARWAQINYQVGEDERASAMADLVEECDGLLEREPDNAQALTWCGIVNSSHAGLASAFSAMKYAKKARAELEKAIELDGEVLSGSAFTSLGTLYFKVPGWPLGFGDKDEARHLLERGLEINPAGIDSNYFYADFLYEQGELEQSREYLVKADSADPRPGREVADTGRQQEISTLLAVIDKELGKR
jgi:tetratricopeptide (TPR) repeat protein